MKAGLNGGFKSMWDRIVDTKGVLGMVIIMTACTDVFDTLHPLFCDVLSSLIRKLNKIPFPPKLLMSHLSSILDIILCIVNLCF